MTDRQIGRSADRRCSSGSSISCIRKSFFAAAGNFQITSTSKLRTIGTMTTATTTTTTTRHDDGHAKGLRRGLNNSQNNMNWAEVASCVNKQQQQKQQQQCYQLNNDGMRTGLLLTRVLFSWIAGINKQTNNNDNNNNSSIDAYIYERRFICKFWQLGCFSIFAFFFWTLQPYCEGVGIGWNVCTAM